MCAHERQHIRTEHMIRFFVLSHFYNYVVSIRWLTKTNFLETQMYVNKYQCTFCHGIVTYSFVHLHSIESFALIYSCLNKRESEIENHAILIRKEHIW